MTGLDPPMSYNRCHARKVMCTFYTQQHCQMEALQLDMWKGIGVALLDYHQPMQSFEAKRESSDSGLQASA